MGLRLRDHLLTVHLLLALEVNGMHSHLNPIGEIMSRLASLLLLTTLAVPVSTARLAAQQNASPAAPTRVAVTVALVDDLPYGGGASAIVRRAEGAFTDDSRHDVIVLGSRGASARELSSAVMDLLAIRGQQGDTASANAVMRVRPRAGSQGEARRVLPWAQRVVNDVRRAEPRLIEGLGEVRAVDIWLPPQQRKAPQLPGVGN
ncbi:hypothetical protein BH23GEM3_BH23GEM3_25990 [soil metagenome]